MSQITKYCLVFVAGIAVGSIGLLSIMDEPSPQQTEQVYVHMSNGCPAGSQAARCQ